MKTALITGATAGFGAACARHFAREGWQLIITGRRTERLTELANELDVPVHCLAFDVSDKQAVKEALESLPEAFSAIDVLVNNAGLALGKGPAQESDLENWETMVDTNTKGLMYMTHAVLPGMVERGSGHIVNVGSIAGSYSYPGSTVYGATKAFVERFSGNLRADLTSTGVRVTNIEPGLAETEFSKVRFKGDEEKAGKIYAGYKALQADDIASSILWAVSQPAHVNISRMEIMPSVQANGDLTVCRK